MVRVLFVCMGNICRSPTAQGVFERLVEEHSLADAIESIQQERTPIILVKNLTSVQQRRH